MNDLVRCSRCRKVLINDEYHFHNCTRETTAIRKVDVDFFTETKDKKGAKVILAQGLDGTMYVLRLIGLEMAKPLPFLTSSLNTNGNSTTENNNGRVNKTKICNFR